MNQYTLNIDGREVLGRPGQTILEVARENSIDIPTLCYDRHTAVYGSCGLCMVEVEGNPKLLKACATQIAPDMVVHTNTERVRESRKTNLELLLSNHQGDCRPPCALSCPAGTDCQGYVGLVANGRFEEAIQLIKERIPLPGCIGRVCPHPCEDNCRRGLVEEPISIAWIKRFAADWDRAQPEPYLPSLAPATGKSVAVVGGGPYGLSAAYFLLRMGHSVTIYDAMPKLGGMLRYGIPQYRLPKDVLDDEIETIRRMGAQLVPNVRIGTDRSFEDLRKEFDAVLVGVGAWVSTGTGCPGEDLPGVMGGIDLLRRVARGESVDLGRRVAVVGGGNTAMDACRTAVRLGVQQVFNVYRRTREEMPADPVEIQEAQEEGVLFQNLTNPLEIQAGPDGRVQKLLLQVMELGEPDASGRRSPLPVEGATQLLEVDTVILAIGQKVDASGLDGLELTRKGGVAYDKDTFRTSLPGVFCGGDCGNDKISIAVESIGDAWKGAQVVDAYLRGEDIAYRKPYTVERHDITEKTFEDRERQCRPTMAQLSPTERKDNFSEVVAGYTPQQAMADAQRCLECGCQDYFDCKLIRYANCHDVHPERLAGEINCAEHKEDHPFLLRDPNKCILCGLCVRMCDEVMGIGALGLVHRGFDTVVKPALEGPLSATRCISCGQCAAVCPTGALMERLPIKKSFPMATDAVESVCSFCSLGCTLDLETGGGMPVRASARQDSPVSGGLLCAKGRFGVACAHLDDPAAQPLVKVRGELAPASLQEAAEAAAAALKEAVAAHGAEAAAVALSPRLTNEEAAAAHVLAQSLGVRAFSFDLRESGLTRVLGVHRSPNTLDELLSTDVILTVGLTAWGSVLRAKLKQAADKGIQILSITTPGMEPPPDDLSNNVEADNNLAFLMEAAKAMLDQGKSLSVPGFDAFAESLAEVEPSPEALRFASLLCKAERAMILFQQNVLSTEAAALLGELAALSGHIGGAGNGIVVLQSRCNSQGLLDLGVQARPDSLEGVKALLCIGQDPAPEYLEGLEFLAVCDSHMTPAARRADAVLPADGFGASQGTYTNTEGRVQTVRPALGVSPVGQTLQSLTTLAGALHADLPPVHVSAGNVPEALACTPVQFEPICRNTPLADPLPSSEYLMTSLERILSRREQ